MTVLLEEKTEVISHLYDRCIDLEREEASMDGGSESNLS